MGGLTVLFPPRTPGNQQIHCLFPSESKIKSSTFLHNFLWVNICNCKIQVHEKMTCFYDSPSRWRTSVVVISPCALMPIETNRNCWKLCEIVQNCDTQNCDTQNFTKKCRKIKDDRHLSRKNVYNHVRSTKNVKPHYRACLRQLDSDRPPWPQLDQETIFPESQRKYNFAYTLLHEFILISKFDTVLLLQIRFESDRLWPFLFQKFNWKCSFWTSRPFILTQCY